MTARPGTADDVIEAAREVVAAWLRGVNATGLELAVLHHTLARYDAAQAEFHRDNPAV